jgi:hypothetical protein
MLTATLVGAFCAGITYRKERKKWEALLIFSMWIGAAYLIGRGG